MKKNLIYIQILLWAAIGIFGLCILGFSIATQIGSNRKEVFYGLELGLLGGDSSDFDKVQNEFSIPYQKVDQIDLQLVSEDVKITAVDQENIEVIEYIRGSGNTDTPIKINASGKTLRITREHQWKLFNIMEAKKVVEIKIPRKYEGKLEIDLVSGDIIVQEGNFDVLDLTTVSGKQKISNIHANKIEQNSTSGTLEDEQIVCKQYKSEGVSGNTQIQFNQLPEEVKVKTISGNIVVDLPDENKGFELQYETVSGRVESDFDVEWDKREKNSGSGIYVKSVGMIRTETVSGNIDIN